MSSYRDTPGDDDRFERFLRGETATVHLFTRAEIEAFPVGSLARANLQVAEDEFQVGLRRFKPEDFRAIERPSSA